MESSQGIWGNFSDVPDSLQLPSYQLVSLQWQLDKWVPSQTSTSVSRPAECFPDVESCGTQKP